MTTELAGLDDLDTNSPVANQFLNEAKSTLKLYTDYKLAKHLQVSPSRINNYRSGRTKPDEGMCLMLEKILEDKYPKGYILIRMQAARSADIGARRLWEDIAEQRVEYWGKRIAPLAAFIAAAVLVALALPDPGAQLAALAVAFPAGISEGALVIMLNLTLALVATLAAAALASTPPRRAHCPAY